jgi:hypothetical protein
LSKSLKSALNLAAKDDRASTRRHGTILSDWRNTTSRAVILDGNTVKAIVLGCYQFKQHADRDAETPSDARAFHLLLIVPVCMACELSKVSSVQVGNTIEPLPAPKKVLCDVLNSPRRTVIRQAVLAAATR